MRFTKLRLNGFKSFVDPTDLVIAEGLTGVVGPNGCGKSNLLDALSWVMGESRPTAIRGGGMEDVIFAGATSRPARNFAEVAISIDNSERLAPAGFNDSDVLEVVRRITRDAGSAYKVGGKDARARDVQMLFADASTGAYSPALVRQGQISELINDRPKARRRILEEAAGISGLHQRRHEAELKLSAAEANLGRIDDVLEQLASQLSHLARQARQAARYRVIGADLRRTEGMLLYCRWKQAERAHLTAAASLGERAKLAAMAETGAQRAARLVRERDADLPALREEEAVAGAVLQRLVVSRDALKDQGQRAHHAIEVLQARIAQLAHDIERETGLGRDASESVARLGRERDEIVSAGAGHESRLAEAEAAAHVAAQALRDREAVLSELSEDVARLAAQHQSADRLVSDLRKMVASNEAEAVAAGAAASAAREALKNAETEVSAAVRAEAEAMRASEVADAALVATDEARDEAQARESDARARLSEADGEAGALRAEVAALARLVERDTVEGGQLLDRVSVQPGYEAALGAALADDLRAPEVSGEATSGWARLAGYARAQALPEGVRALSDHVTVPEVLARRIAQIGLVERHQGMRLQASLLPGQRLVSPDGDLWRWDGFRAGADAAPSAAALRLQQINRLQELRRDFEEANARAEGARQAHAVLTRRLEALNRADQSAREARHEADRHASQVRRALARAEADRSIAAGKLESARLAAARFSAEAKAARLRLREAEAARTGLAPLADARARATEARAAVENARAGMLARRSAHDELRREGEARVRRAREIDSELAGWRRRLQTAVKRVAELGDRRKSAEEELAAAQTVPDEIAARRRELDDAIIKAEARRRKAADALAQAETAYRAAAQAEREAARLASEAREARARAEALSEAAQSAVAQAAGRIRDDLATSPASLLETLDVEPQAMPAVEALEQEMNRLRRQRDALGAVNLRAEEDAHDLRDEHDALAAEKADLEAAIAKLRSGISSLNREGRERLLTAFEQVNEGFARLFSHLFGGGAAKLALVESDDPLEAGLEIYCQPPGKKLSTLLLLSGGEQTLTALALIFAVFLSNPAPICVLDEVDAPLDDANVTRLCDMLDEMIGQTETRFLVITHHAVTMSRMHRLFGVTMAEKGVSQLVSVDLTRAGQLLA